MQVKSFLPKNLQDTKVYAETTDVIQKVIDDNTLDRDIIKNKYSNVVTTTEVLKEAGYSYIIDILALAPGQANIVASLVAILHFLKGTKEGLKTVLSLLDIQYKIIEWWEKSPKGTINTFDLHISLDFGSIPIELLDRLKVFIINYVHPVLGILGFTVQASVGFFSGGTLPYSKGALGAFPMQQLYVGAGYTQPDYVYSPNTMETAISAAGYPFDWYYAYVSTLEGTGFYVDTNYVANEFNPSAI